MERQSPQIGHTYERGTSGVVKETHEENHLGVPGEEGAHKIDVTTVRNKDGMVSQIRVDRGHSIVPSMVTDYSYKRENGKRKLVAMRTRLYREGDSSYYFVEEVREGEITVFPEAPEVRTLSEQLGGPKPGEVQDLSDAIKKAKNIRHLAVNVIEDGLAVLITRVKTDLESGITYMTFTVLVPTLDEKPRVESLTALELWGIDGRSMEPLPITKRFIYEDRKCMGMDQYVGNELQFRERYKNPHSLILKGKEVEVFDKDRDYGEWAKTETGQSGQYGTPYVDSRSGMLMYKFSHKP